MPRLKTPNDGAAITRRQILRHVRQLMEEEVSDFISGPKLIEFIRSMPKRAAQRAGGLGRSKRR